MSQSDPKTPRELHLQIDGQDVTAPEGATVLEAARGADISSIPTLCHHDKLQPYGGCRLCLVEVTTGADTPRARTQHVVSCVYPAAEGLVVRTRTDKVDRIRKTLLELLLAHAPESPQLKPLADEYGAQPNRFPQDPSFCVHCGLCVRYCAEVKGKHAVGFVNRGPHKEIRFIPEIALNECMTCMECFPLCPTSYLQSAFVLVQGLAGPTDPA